MSEVESRLKVKRSDFYAVLAEELLDFVDNVEGESNDDHAKAPTMDPLNGHVPLSINHRECMRCAVCKLEENWIDKASIPKGFGAGSRQQRHLAVCSVCGITAHALPVQWNQRIFNLEPIHGLSCFQLCIIHFVQAYAFQRVLITLRL